MGPKIPKRLDQCFANSIFINMWLKETVFVFVSLSHNVTCFAKAAVMSQFFMYTWSGKGLIQFQFDVCYRSFYSILPFQIIPQLAFNCFKPSSYDYPYLATASVVSWPSG